MEIFKHEKQFQLENGNVLDSYHLAYTTYGKLNAVRNNVVWVFHALTANSDPQEWWPGLVGNGKLFDPKKYFIVCVNMPGSHYGSIGPLHENPGTGQPFYSAFPQFTVRDMVRSYIPLRQYLGIEKIYIGIGGSMGGQQLLEWAIEEPELFENIVPMATNAYHSPWGIAFNASQRMAIEADESWKENSPTAGLNGMKVARGIALLSYRHYDSYNISQKETGAQLNGSFRSETYQQYQGEKLAKRFNAFSYYFLSRSMDLHHVGRGRESAEKALSKIKARTLVIGIENDLLFPPAEQKFIAEHIPGAQLKIISSHYGHDGFLLEYDAIGKHIKQLLTI